MPDIAEINFVFAFEFLLFINGDKRRPIPRKAKGCLSDILLIEFCELSGGNYQGRILTA